MIEGYCVKCKAKRPIGDAVEEQMKNGRKAVKGKCPACGAVMFKILGGKAVPPIPAAPSSAAPAADSLSPETASPVTAATPSQAPVSVATPPSAPGPAPAPAPATETPAAQA